MSRQNCSRRNSLSRKSYESLPFRSDSPESRFDDNEDRVSSRYVDGTGNRGETRRRYSIQESNRRRENLENSHSQSRPYGLNSCFDNRDSRSSSCDKKCQQRSETSSRLRERLDRRSSCCEVLHGRSSHHAGDRHERRDGRISNLNSEAERRRREQRAREDRERRFSRSAADFDGNARRRDSDSRQERRISKSESYSRSDFDIHRIRSDEVQEERERSHRDRRRERCTFSKSDNGLDINDDSERRRDRERTDKTKQEADLHNKVNQILDQISHMKVKSDLENKSSDRKNNDSHQSVGSKGSKISHQSQSRQSTGMDKVVAESACTTPTAASSIANSTISSLGHSAHFEAEFLASINTYNANEEDQDLGSLLNGSGREHFIERKKGAPSAVVKSAPVTPVTFKHKESALTEEDLGSLLDVTGQDHVVETKKGSGDDALASLKSKLLNSRPFKSKESVSVDKTQCRKVSEFSLFLKKAHQDCKSHAVTPNSQNKLHAAIPATGILKATTTPPPPPKHKIGTFAPLRKSKSQPTEKRVESTVVLATRDNVPPPPPKARPPMHFTRTGAVPPPPPPPLVRRPLDTRCTPASLQNSQRAPNATTSLKKNVPTPPPPSRDVNNKSSKVPPPQAKSAQTTTVSSPPIQPKPTIQPEQKTKLINPINNRRQKHVTNMPHTDQFGDFGFYTGEVDEDVRPHGQGKMKYENGVFFEGKWKNGNQDSSAVLQRERMLSGFTSWRGVHKKEACGGNGACHVYGMAWIDNSGMSGKYTGKVNDKNLPHGMGKMAYDMGLIAEGEWVHGVLNGAAQNGPMMGAGATVVPGGTIFGGGMSVLGGGGMSVFSWNDHHGRNAAPGSGDVL